MSQAAGNFSIVHSSIDQEMASVGARVNTSAASGMTPGILPDFRLTCIALVAVVGLALTSYLSWAGLTSSKLAGCDGGQWFDCGHVLKTKWSTAFGVPVGIPAAALYLLTLAASLTARLTDRVGIQQLAAVSVSFLAFVAGLAAIWFISLQLFVVDHLCQYCLGAHACGLTLTGLALWRLPLGFRRTVAVWLVAMLTMGMVAGSQAASAEPPKFEIVPQPSIERSEQSDGELFTAPGDDEDSGGGVLFEAPISSVTPAAKPSGSIDRWLLSATPLLNLNVALMAAPVGAIQEEEQGKQDSAADAEKPERRIISLAGGRLKLDVRQWPLDGKPDADTVIVEMFDYTCPHCRANHQAVRQAQEQSQGALALVALAVPMNTACNNTVRNNDPKHAEACELAKLSVAVWRVDPDQFSEFHQWLFTGPSVPSYSQAKAKADQLVGKEKLDAEIKTQLCDKYIARHVELYKQLGAGTVPKLLFPNSTIVGQTNASTLMQMIK